MKSYKMGYVESFENGIRTVIQAVITKVIISEQNGLTETDEEELKRYAGFNSVEEAIDFLNSYKVKKIEIEY